MTPTLTPLEARIQAEGRQLIAEGLPVTIVAIRARLLTRLEPRQVPSESALATIRQKMIRDGTYPETPEGQATRLARERSQRTKREGESKQVRPPGEHGEFTDDIRRSARILRECRAMIGRKGVPA